MRFGLGLLIFGVLLTACADSGQKCGNKFLALWPTSTGDYEFQELTLQTLNDPYALSGGAAKIYFENLIGGGGFTGKVAHPQYTRSGDLCVPTDTASSMAISVYARFESLLRFETELGTRDMVSWPRKVGLDIHVRSSEGVTHNNAHYFGQGDLIAVLPYNLQGVPLALNPGVMAHEHFHAHFQRQVMDVTNSQLAPTFNIESLFYGAFALGTKPSPGDINENDTRSFRGLNAFVLRAWNEGLADVFGGIYAENPRFFRDSLPAFKDTRALDASLVTFRSADSFKKTAERTFDSRELVAISYEQGAALARVMYSISQSGVETPREFLKGIMNNLKNIPPAIIPVFDQRVLEFEEVLPILLRDFPLPAAQCDLLRQVLNKDTIKSLSACQSHSVSH